MNSAPSDPDHPAPLGEDPRPLGLLASTVWNAPTGQLTEREFWEDVRASWGRLFAPRLTQEHRRMARKQLGLENLFVVGSTPHVPISVPPTYRREIWESTEDGWRRVDDLPWPENGMGC